MHTLRTLFVVAALLAITLVAPTSAECKVKAGTSDPKSATTFTPAPQAAAANATEAAITDEVGADADSSKNKIQNAPKKRMKNKILFDVTKPKAKTDGTSASSNNSPGGTATTTSQQSASN